MILSYPAIFTPQGNSIIVEAPELGVIVKANDKEQAFTMVSKAIEQKLNSQAFGKNVIPMPVDIKNVDLDRTFYYNPRKSEVMLVPVTYKSA